MRWSASRLCKADLRLCFRHMSSFGICKTFFFFSWGGSYLKSWKIISTFVLSSQQYNITLFPFQKFKNLKWTINLSQVNIGWTDNEILCCHSYYYYSNSWIIPFVIIGKSYYRTNSLYIANGYSSRTGWIAYTSQMAMSRTGWIATAYFKKKLHRTFHLIRHWYYLLKYTKWLLWGAGKDWASPFFPRGKNWLVSFFPPPPFTDPTYDIFKKKLHGTFHLISHWYYFFKYTKWLLWGGGKDWAGPFFLRGKKLTSQFLPPPPLHTPYIWYF